MLENFQILFRGNNAAPRIITSFVHMCAGHYLSDTFGPLLREAFRDPRLQGFSVSPEVDAEERDANLRYIQTVAKKFLDAIVGSADSFPPYYSSGHGFEFTNYSARALREIFHHISVCTATRFSGNATAPHIGVGGIAFLRFIGPAIVEPASVAQSSEERRPGIKRALVLITKIIQNLASNAMFPETHMLSLNAFLEANIKRVLEFIRKISVLPILFVELTIGTSNDVDSNLDAD